MLQSFPYLAASQANYTKETNRYLYTGILYDSRDLSRIVDVEEGVACLHCRYTCR